MTNNELKIIQYQLGPTLSAKNKFLNVINHLWKSYTQYDGECYEDFSEILAGIKLKKILVKDMIRRRKIYFDAKHFTIIIQKLTLHYFGFQYIDNNYMEFDERVKFVPWIAFWYKHKKKKNPSLDQYSNYNTEEWFDKIASYSHLLFMCDKNKIQNHMISKFSERCTPSTKSVKLYGNKGNENYIENVDEMQATERNNNP